MGMVWLNMIVLLREGKVQKISLSLSLSSSISLCSIIIALFASLFVLLRYAFMRALLDELRALMGYE